MTEFEKPSGQEFKKPTEIFPRPSVIKTLRGTISERIETTSHKPGEEGQHVKVRLVLDGAGIFGIDDKNDNKKWAETFNQSLLFARYALHFEKTMNPQTLLDAMLVSQAGDRVWEEAHHYPDAVPNSAEKTAKSKIDLGLEIIKNKVPQDVYDLLNDESKNRKVKSWKSNISHILIPMPQWEHELRKQYVEAARLDIIAEIFALKDQAKRGNDDALKRLTEEYPENNWWGRYAKDVYREHASQKPEQKRQRYRKIQTIYVDKKYL